MVFKRRINYCIIGIVNVYIGVIIPVNFSIDKLVKLREGNRFKLVWRE